MEEGTGSREWKLQQHDLRLREIQDRKRELMELSFDQQTILEKMMAEREMPVVSVKKQDLGDPRWSRYGYAGDSDVEIKPTEENTGDDLRRINWMLRKTSEKTKSLPAVTGHEVTHAEIREFGATLAESHIRFGKDEKAILFRNESGEPVGWVAVFESQNLSEKHCHLMMIGANPKLEGQGYGSAILTWLKEQYDSIDGTLTAYDMGDVGGTGKIDRLKRFYVKNGFLLYDSLGWKRSRPNLEDAPAGEWVTAKSEMVVNGFNQSDARTMELYLGVLDEEKRLKTALGEEGALLARSWIEVRREWNLQEEESQERLTMRDKDEYS